MKYDSDTKDSFLKAKFHSLDLKNEKILSKPIQVTS